MLFVYSVIEHALHILFLAWDWAGGIGRPNDVKYRHTLSASFTVDRPLFRRGGVDHGVARVDVTVL